MEFSDIPPIQCFAFVNLTRSFTCETQLDSFASLNIIKLYTFFLPTKK